MLNTFTETIRHSLTLIRDEPRENGVELLSEKVGERVDVEVPDLNTNLVADDSAEPKHVVA
jgi:hypothetical protein